MAIVRVSSEYLKQALFHNANCEIKHAAGPGITGNFVFHIDGADVPNVAEVNAVITKQSKTVKFEAR